MTFGNEWNDANVGIRSIALGAGVTASGNGAVAFMDGNANGDESAAIGENAITDAAATGAIAIGQNSQANATISVTIGNSNVSSGNSSTAIGNQSQATGDFSMAIGSFANAIGETSLALSNGAASGDNSLAWRGSTAGLGSMALMGGNTNGDESAAIGENAITDAAATGAIAIGQNSQANATTSVAIGNSNVSSGNSSTTIGNQSQATGNFSMALGSFANASGVSSVALSGGSASGEESLAWRGGAMGEGSIAFAGGNANSSESIAIGSNTISQAEKSIDIGNDLTSYSYAETVIGYNSAAYTPSSTSLAVGTDRLLVIANNTLENAITVLKDGKTGFSRIPTTNVLEINGDASKNAAGDWLANSDRRLKKNINTFNSDEALKKLLQMRGVTYEWNDKQTGNNRPEGQQYGFIAQELQEIFPENVSLDNQGFYQTAYCTYDALYVQSIKALYTKIEALEKENEELKSKLDELYGLVKGLISEE
ncbi:tail fiber domain-containing protein [Winogradskyella sp.]|uniref:tail fiber domain-containing protein n=1 Tax=Winogradskyella sp. TaxID=1883156 RepID=UPI003F6B3755